MSNGVASWCEPSRIAHRVIIVNQPVEGLLAGRIMLRTLGFLMQLAVLALLPMLILWQLMFGFRLILMPALTLTGIAVFMTGHWLREA